MNNYFYDFFKPGDHVQHFKHELQHKTDLNRIPNLCRYRIVGLATHSETRAELVIYESLYSKDRAGNYKLYARPVEFFLSPVDRQKYPNVKQRYRFEKIDS